MLFSVPLMDARVLVTTLGLAQWPASRNSRSATIFNDSQGFILRHTSVNSNAEKTSGEHAVVIEKLIQRRCSGC
ncbi:hypothetical protein F4604DRAFT_1760874 [Suillus subluteus]|nr:hypothetical protein F4604DRAFT_1760874 [Suillus subluteus]